MLAASNPNRSRTMSSNTLSNIPVAMSSREIAELTSKRHDHVLRDIDNLLESLSPELGNGFQSSTYVSGDPPREYRQYLMAVSYTHLDVYKRQLTKRG